MATKKNRFEFESPETKQKFINEIIAFFHDERGENIGVIAAENILNFFVDLLGDEIYKKGIQDSKKLVREKLNDLEIELDILKPSK